MTVGFLANTIFGRFFLSNRPNFANCPSPLQPPENYYQYNFAALLIPAIRADSRPQNFPHMPQQIDFDQQVRLKQPGLPKYLQNEPLKRLLFNFFQSQTAEIVDILIGKPIVGTDLAAFLPSIGQLFLVLPR